MKIKITVEVDTPAEAKTIIDRMSRDYQTWVDLRDPAPTSQAHLEKQIAKIEEKGERENVNPGEPAIGKIGGSTKDWILGELAEDRAASHFGAKYEEHLKLLWKRGEVKYDGELYYLS